MRCNSPEEAAAECRRLGDAMVALSRRMAEFESDPEARRDVAQRARYAEVVEVFNRFEAEAEAWISGGCRGEVPVVPECLTGPLFKPRHGV